MGPTPGIVVPGPPCHVASGVGLAVVVQAPCLGLVCVQSLLRTTTKPKKVRGETASSLGTMAECGTKKLGAIPTRV